MEQENRQPSKYWDNPDLWFTRNQTPLSEQEAAELLDREIAYRKAIIQTMIPQIRTYQKTKQAVMNRLTQKFETFICTPDDAHIYQLTCLYFSGSAEFEQRQMPNDKLGSLKKGLYIAGGVGTGKTSLMWEFAAKPSLTELYHNGYNISVKAEAIVAEYEKADKDGGGEISLQKYINAKVFHLDELGREPKCNRFGERNPIEVVLSRRYDRWQHDSSYITHITTNVTDAGVIENAYGDYMRDRFKDMFNKLHWLGGSKRG